MKDKELNKIYKKSQELQQKSKEFIASIDDKIPSEMIERVAKAAWDAEHLPPWENKNPNDLTIPFYYRMARNVIEAFRHPTKEMFHAMLLDNYPDDYRRGIKYQIEHGSKLVTHNMESEVLMGRWQTMIDKALGE